MGRRLNGPIRYYVPATSGRPLREEMKVLVPALRNHLLSWTGDETTVRARTQKRLFLPFQLMIRKKLIGGADVYFSAADDHFEMRVEPGSRLWDLFQEGIIVASMGLFGLIGALWALPQVPPGRPGLSALGFAFFIGMGAGLLAAIFLLLVLQPLVHRFLSALKGTAARDREIWTRILDKALKRAVTLDLFQEKKGSHAN